MQRRRHKTERPSWMRLAVQLAGWVVMALFSPLLLGIIFDIFTGLSPFGLLFGMATGMTIALIIVLRTIQKRLFILAPSTDAEDAKESL